MAPRIDEAIYSVEVTFPNNPAVEDSTFKRTKVLYCDICRRWGEHDSSHLCWRNWRVRLSDALADLTRGDRR